MHIECINAWLERIHLLVINEHSVGKPEASNKWGWELYKTQKGKARGVGVAIDLPTGYSIISSTMEAIISDVNLD